MTEEEIRTLTAIIRTWEPDDQTWWRALLEQAPAEALVVGELVLKLDAKPTHIFDEELALKKQAPKFVCVVCGNECGPADKNIDGSYACRQCLYLNQTVPIRKP